MFAAQALDEVSAIGCGSWDQTLRAQKGRTYNVPPAKTTMIRNLRFNEVSSCHTKGIGSTKIARSVTMLVVQSATKMVDSVVMQSPGTMVSQALWIGLHLKTLMKKAGV